MKSSGAPPVLITCLSHQNGTDGRNTTKECIFAHCMPLLRSEYSKPSINFGLSSLFTISSISSIPIHMQCIFAKCFLAICAEIEECPYYNVLKMRLSNQITLSITLDSKCLEGTAEDLAVFLITCHLNCLSNN